VKNAMFDRRLAYGNRERTNRLLLLMQLHANDRAREPAYAKRIRDHLIQADGLAPERRTILDHGGVHSIRH
jgi:hypothetical protein